MSVGVFEVASHIDSESQIKINLIVLAYYLQTVFFIVFLSFSISSSWKYPTTIIDLLLIGFYCYEMGNECPQCLQTKKEQGN